MPAQELKKLLERIHTRLDESLVGIGQMVSDLDAADLAELINQLTLAEAATVVSMLPLQRAIEICDQPTMRRRAAILEQLEPPRVAEMRAELEGLLQYPAHTAGGIMTTEFVRLDPKMTVGDALKHIRSVAQEKESIYACYVMEPGTGRLLGAVSLRDLVMAELEAPLTKVMRTKPVTVNAFDDQEVVAQK